MKPLYQSMIFTGALLALTTGAFAQSNSSTSGSVSGSTGNSVTSGTAGSNTTAPAGTSTFETNTTGRNATGLDARQGTATTLGDRNDSYTGMDNMDSDDTDTTATDSTTDTTTGISAGSSPAIIGGIDANVETKAIIGAPVATGFDANEVREVQNALRSHGYTISADGVWGNQTISTLRRFQKENNLTETGKLDTPTRTALKMRTSAMTDDASASDATANR